MMSDRPENLTEMIRSVLDGQRRTNELVSEIAKHVVQVEASIPSLRIDLMSRMERLENRLTEIRDDIGVNMGAVDQAHRATDSTRDELRLLGEQVTIMYRQIKRLETRVNEITGSP